MNTERVPNLTEQDLKGYLGMVQKHAVIHRAELVKNPFDLNAMHNLNLLDYMAIEAINRYLNQ